MKKRLAGLWLVLVLVLIFTISVFADEATVVTWGREDKATDTGNDYLALGADLSADQLNTVLSLMNITPEELNSCNVVYIDNATEHQYLDTYVDPAVIGTKSLSSVLVRPQSEGYGVKVKTININFCTEGMYRNALLTAGVKNADITVVGPTSISGTAALIGALKAYEEMSGKEVTEQTLDTALNELVTTGEIADAVGDSDDIEEMIAFIKAEIADKDLDTKEDIEEAVREAAKDYGATLTEEEIHRIVDLMIKIKDLGLDYDTLLDQASDLYSKFGDKMLNADGSLSSEVKSEIIKQAVGNFFTKAFEKAGDLFKGLFSK